MPASHYFFCVTGARTVNSHFCMTNDTTSYEFVYSTVLFVSYIIKKFLFIIVQLCISSSFSFEKKKGALSNEPLRHP
jgi:hypothetical protein